MGKKLVGCIHFHRFYIVASTTIWGALGGCIGGGILGVLGSRGFASRLVNGVWMSLLIGSAGSVVGMESVLPWDPTERRELSRASVLFMLDVEAQMMRRQDFAPLVQKTGARTLLQSQHHEQSEQRQEGKEANP